jgi:NADPH:quinone reductase-like Zn-dependent oxidoreductase
MKVYQVQPGAGLDGLSLDERSEQMPAPRQVLMKVKAVSLNDRDLLILKSFYPGITKPVVPVSDGVGEIVARGSGVTRVKVGDRVMGCLFFFRSPAFSETLLKSPISSRGFCGENRRKHVRTPSWGSCSQESGLFDS